MATDPRKRQKQLAKKTARRKAVVASKKHSGSPARAMSGARQMAVAAQAPLYECLMGQETFERGMGTVIVSRLMPTGGIGAAFFLLDVFCLGVKNAYFVAESRDAYLWRLEHVAHNERLISIPPEYARKLVEDAEAYAHELGFAPHADYQLAKKIFADIDATACTTHFTFGKDGKPLYIEGPSDTSQRLQKILDTLHKARGPQGFDYIVQIEGLPGFVEEDFEGEDDDTVIEAEYKRLP